MTKNEQILKTLKVSYQSQAYTSNIEGEKLL